MERTRTKPGGTHHQEMGRREGASEGTRRGRARNILGISGRKYIVGEGYAQCSDRSSKVGLRAATCSSWEIAGSRDKRSFGGLLRQAFDRNKLLGKWKEGSRESPCGQHFAAKMSKATDKQLAGEGNQGDLCLPFQDGEREACLYAAGNDLLPSDSLILLERQGEALGWRPWACPSDALLSRTLASLLCRACGGNMGMGGGIRQRKSQQPPPV